MKEGGQLFSRKITRRARLACGRFRSNQFLSASILPARISLPSGDLRCALSGRPEQAAEIVFFRNLLLNRV